MSGFIRVRLEQHRTTYLNATDPDLAAQLQQAIRDRCTVLVYGVPSQRARLARAVLSAEAVLRRSLRVTREHDRWVISR